MNVLNTQYVYPLFFRERLNNAIDRFFYKGNFNDKDISLEFNPKVRLDLKQNDIGHKSIILNGFYELRLSRQIISLAKNGGLLIDVGANYGYFSCLWAAAKNENSVIAFEANPSNIQPLQRNIEKNNLSNRVKINSFALSKEKGKMNFYTGQETDQTGWGGLAPNRGGAGIEVEVDTLDNIIAGKDIDKIDVLKIDTEGADTWVLYGASDLLKQKKINHIFFESNRVRMEQLNIKHDDALNFLKDFGYSIELLAENEYYAHL